jgi:hypothetical protein
MHPTVPHVYKPMLLCNGKRLAFPKPTETIQAPKDLARQRAKQGRR